MDHTKSVNACSLPPVLASLGEELGLGLGLGEGLGEGLAEGLGLSSED